MKVFIGASEVAGFIGNLALGFRRLGHRTCAVVGTRHPFYNFDYDEVISEVVPESGGGGVARALKDRIARRIHLWRLMRRVVDECDVLIYVTGGSLLPFYLDYRLAKSLGRRLVVIFLGTEIRHWFPYQLEMESMGRLDLVRPYVDHLRRHPYGSYFQKRRRLIAAERHADLILSQPGHGQLQRRPYMRVPVVVDISSIPFRPRDRRRPVVVHAPSDPGVKGTDVVVEAVQQLRGEGIEFDFQLLNRVPHDTLIETLAEADVLVDELYSDTVGVLSIEAMAAGNVALTAYLPEYAKVPSPCPALPVDARTVGDTLRRVLLNEPLRERLAREGREYAACHHDAPVVAAKILEWLEPGGCPAFDFTPAFYRRCRVPARVLLGEATGSALHLTSRLTRLFHP